MYLNITLRSEDIVNMAKQMGKRYSCGTCEAEVVVTKAGDGELQCHDQSMTVK